MNHDLAKAVNVEAAHMLCTENANHYFETNRQITVFSNHHTQECFLTTSSFQFLHTHEEQGWVSVTLVLPAHVAPRPSLPTGLITNTLEAMLVYFGDQTLIPNPNPKYALNKEAQFLQKYNNYKPQYLP